MTPRPVASFYRPHVSPSWRKVFCACLFLQGRLRAQLRNFAITIYKNSTWKARDVREVRDRTERNEYYRRAAARGQASASSANTQGWW